MNTTIMSYVDAAFGTFMFSVSFAILVGGLFLVRLVWKDIKGEK